MPRSKKYCSVPGCGERCGAMFLFPKDYSAREKWKSLCKITREPSNFMLVCYRHFSSEDVYVSVNGTFKRLKPGVVPRFHLPKSVRRRGHRSCSVHTCERDEFQDVSLHYFPKNAEMRKRWASICKMPVAPSRNTRICSAHFQPEDFTFTASGVKSLKSSVVPSRKLPTVMPCAHPLSKSKMWSVSYGPDGGDSAGDSSDDSNALDSFECADRMPQCAQSVGSALNELPGVVVNHQSLSVVQKLMTEYIKASSSVPSLNFSFDSFFSRFLLDSVSTPQKDQDYMKDSVLHLFTSDHHMRKLTGVGLKMLNVLVELLSYVAPALQMSTLSVRERITLSLCKLKHDVSFDFLSSLFNVPVSECVKCFHCTIQVLGLILEPAIRQSLIEEHNKGNAIDLDLCEIGLEFPSCVQCLSCNKIQLDERQPLKVLLGLSSSGLVVYLSKCFFKEATFEKIFLGIEEGCREKLERFVPRVGEKEEHQMPSHLSRVKVQVAFQRMKSFKILKAPGWSVVPIIDSILTVTSAMGNLGSHKISFEPLDKGKDCGC